MGSGISKKIESRPEPASDPTTRTASPPKKWHTLWLMPATHPKKVDKNFGSAAGSRLQDRIAEEGKQMFKGFSKLGAPLS